MQASSCAPSRIFVPINNRSLPTINSEKQTQAIPVPISILSIENAIIKKLEAIGMLQSNGELTIEAIAILSCMPIQLNSKQLRKMDEILEKDFTIVDKDGFTHFTQKQKICYTRNLAHLASLQFRTKETYLCGEMARKIIGIKERFSDLVKIFLKAKSLPEDYLDNELHALSESKEPQIIEWQDCIENLDSSALDILESGYAKCFSELSYSNTPATYEQCFLSICKSASYVEFTFGDQTKKGNVLVTKRTIGIKNPLITLEAIRIPVSRYILSLHIQPEIPQAVIVPNCTAPNFAQCIVDSALGLVRLIREPQDENDWAKLVLYLSQNNFFVGNISALKKDVDQNHINALRLVAIQHNGNLASLAAAASSISKKPSKIWNDLPLDDRPFFFAEMQRLVVNEKVSLQTIRALLCYAAWIRLNNPNEDWQRATGISVSLREHNDKAYFTITSGENSLRISVKPNKLGSILCHESTENLEKLKRLWQLIIPFSSDKHELNPFLWLAPHLLENFKIFTSAFIEHDILFLNQLGFKCALATKDQIALGKIFNKLLFIASNIEDLKKDLSSLSFILCGIPFHSTQTRITTIVVSFIHHLLCHKQSGNALTLLKHLLQILHSERDRSSVCLELLEMQFAADNAFALQIYKKLLPEMTEQDARKFFLKVSSHYELFHELLSVAKEFLAFVPEIDEILQSKLLELIQQGVSISAFESCLQLLKKIAAQLNDAVWEKGALLVCNAILAKRGKIEALKAWEALCKLKSIPLPLSLIEALRLESEKKVAISKYVLIHLPPRQQVEAILGNWCSGLDKEDRKTILTSSMIRVIRDEKDWIDYLFDYEWSKKNCFIDQIQSKLIALFHEDLKQTQAMLHFIFLLKLANAKCLASKKQEALLLLSNKLTDLPSAATKIHSSLSEKEQVCLDLARAMTFSACTHSNLSFTVATVSLLETLWSENPTFSKELAVAIAPYEQTLFRVLIRNHLFDSAYSFFTFVEVYKIPRSPKSVESRDLCELFRDRIHDSHLPLSKLKFAIQTKRINTKEAIELLILLLPTLPDKKECQEMLLTRLNQLDQTTLSNHYGSLLQAFGEEKKEAIDFILSIKNCNKAKAFQEASAFFNEMKADDLIEVLQKNSDLIKAHSTVPSRNMKSTRIQAVVDSTMLTAFELGLLRCVAAKTDLSKIFELMNRLNFWPSSILQAIKETYREDTSETLFQFFYDNRRRFHAPKAIKKEFFKELFEALLSQPTKYLFEFTNAYSELEPLFPNDERANIKFKYLLATIDLIQNPVENKANIAALAVLRSTTSTALPLEYDIRLVQCYLETADIFLINKAFVLVTEILPGLDKSENELLLPLIKKLAIFQPSPETATTLNFFAAACCSYPAIFNEQAKIYIENELMKECQTLPESNSHEERIIALFISWSRKPNKQSILLQSHYSQHFAPELSRKAFAFCRLALSRSLIKYYAGTAKEQKIAMSLVSFSQSLKENEFFLEAIKNPRYDSLFKKTLNEAIFSLIRLAYPLNKHELFVENFTILFKQLESLHPVDDVKAYYLQAIYWLVNIPQSPFIIKVLNGLLEKKLFPLPEELKESFDTYIKQLVYTVLSSSPLKEKQTYEDLLELLKNLISSTMVSPAILRLNIIVHYVLCHGIGLPYEITESIAETIKESLQECVSKPSHIAFNNAYHLLRRARLIFVNQQNIAIECCQIYFSALPLLDLNTAIAFIKYGARDFSTSSPGYIHFANALLAILEKEMATPDLNTFYKLKALINGLHADSDLENTLLLQCHTLLFKNIKRLNSDDALSFVYVHTKEVLIGAHEIFAEKKGTEEDKKLVSIIIYNFFKIVLVDHGFQECTYNYLQQASIFLLRLQDISFFDGNYERFSRMLKSLIPVQQKDSEETNETELNFLYEQFADFEKRTSLHEEDCLLALFEFFQTLLSAYRPAESAELILTRIMKSLQNCFSSNYFKHARDYYALVRAILPHSLKFLTPINSSIRFLIETLGVLCPLQAPHLLKNAKTEEAIFVSLFKNIEEMPWLITESTHKALYGFLNSYILQNQEMGHQLLQLSIASLEKLYNAQHFTNNPTLYYSLVGLLIPANRELVQNSQPENDILCNALKLTPSKMPQITMVKDILEISAKYIQEMALIDHKDVRALQAGVLLRMKIFLQHHLRKNVFRNEEATYLQFIRIFIPCNTALLKSQLNNDEKGLNCIHQLLFQEYPNNVHYSTSAMILAKTEVVALYATAIIGLSTPGMLRFCSGIIKTSAMEIEEATKAGHFNANFSHYFSSVKHLIPFSVILIHYGIKENSIYKLLLGPTPKPINMQVETVAVYVSALISKSNAQTIELGIDIVKQMTTTIKGLAQKAYFDKCPDNYYQLFEMLIPCHVNLIRHGLDSNMQIEDVIFEGIMDADLEEIKAFFTPKSLASKLKVAAMHLEKLHTIRHPKPTVQEVVVNFRTELLGRTVTLVKRLLVNKSFNAETFPVYLGYVKLLVKSNVDLIESSIALGLVEKDFISDLLFCPEACKPYFTTPALNRLKCDIAMAFANALFKLKEERANLLACGILKKATNGK